MTERKHSEAAASVAQSIRDLASNPERLDNLESYLSSHFAAWLERYASDPESIACELKAFVEM